MRTLLRVLARTGLMITGLLLIVTACSAPDENAGASDGSYRPVTVSHQYGSTTIDRLPTRVITVGGNWTDTLVALDVPITAEYRVGADGQAVGAVPWQPAHSGEVVTATSAADIDFTALAAFKPDVIVAGYLGSKQIYDQLSKLAPTIPVMSTDAVMDSWQDITTTAGKIFDKQDKAAELVRGVEAKVADFKSKNPGTQGKTATFGATTPAGQIGVVTNPADPSLRVLTELGFRPDPAVNAVAGSASGRAFISPERMDVLSSDLLLMWVSTGSTADLAKLPGWSGLRAVKSGAVVSLSTTTQAAFNTPSVLSVPFAIGLIEPVAPKIT